MDIIEAYVTRNKCFQAGEAIYPQWLMLHSIGVPQSNAAAWEAKS